MTPCIEWDRAIRPDGYGHIRREGKNWLAHRWAWTQAHGPIPPGMCVMHRCDNPPCVNVEHLSLGTHQDNIRDMDAKGRRVAHQTKLTQADVDLIQSLPCPYGQQQAMADRFGVHRRTLYRVRSGNHPLCR